MTIIILIGVLVAFGAFIFFKVSKSRDSSSGSGSLPSKYDQDEK